MNKEKNRYSNCENDKSYPDVNSLVLLSEKGNDIQTYKEIVAFSEYRRLDEIQKQREVGKRPYQKLLLAIGSAVIATVACLLIGFLIHITDEYLCQ